MMNMNYVLEKDHSVRPETDTKIWAKWFETADRRVALDILSGDVTVSTVFLGIDHNFGIEGPPLLFETMIFGGPHDQYQDRYSTWQEAVNGHAQALAMAQR